MGVKLITEVLDHAPADLTPTETLVLVVLAESARDETREAWPGIDQLARRCRVKPDSIQKALRRLADRGIDVRVPLGHADDGRPVYAAKGHRTTYRIPSLQRPDQSPPNRDERADHSPGIDTAKGGPQSGKGRTTVRQRADHHPPLPLIEPSKNRQSAGRDAALQAFDRSIRFKPPCQHGKPGGDIPYPDWHRTLAGQPACVQCRHAPIKAA